MPVQTPIRVKEAAFVCYPVADMARARQFYEGVLGLSCTNPESDNWYEYELGNDTLVLGQMEGWQPTTDGPTLGLEVEDLDTSLAALKEAGAKVDDAMDTPVCRMAMVEDSEGNCLVIHQRK